MLFLKGTTLHKGASLSNLLMLSTIVVCTKIMIVLSAVNLNSKCPAEFDYQLHTFACVPVVNQKLHKELT